VLERAPGATEQGESGTLDDEKVIRHHSNMPLSKSAAAKKAVPSCDDLCGVPCFKEDLVKHIRASLPLDDAVDAARVMFAALADGTRLKILYALRDGEELCVCDVAHVLGMSVSATSHHLRKLRDLKILTYRNDGKMAYYSLRDRFVAELARQALRQALS
jgi:DNA-binding transcriptional ArsR family regulator